MSMSTAKLFSPLTLGGDKDPLEISHRVVMSPVTRLRADDDGVLPAFAATYYAQRATPGGLLISEAANISPTAGGYYCAPGVYSPAQLESWKRITKAVHDKGGKIFCQLWHTGRVSHPLTQPNGQLPVSSSSTPFEGKSSVGSVADITAFAFTKEGRKRFELPRALETHEIAEIIEDYRRASLAAMDVGFDGVELHAANGYLLEQFLCDSVNARTDQYGGSIENRARIIFEVLDAMIASVGSSRVAIRLTPYGVTFGCHDSTPYETYGYVVRKLNEDYNLAFLDLIEPRGIFQRSELVPEDGVLPAFRKLYKGVLFGGAMYDRELAIKEVEAGAVEAVTFGRPFIANPDLVARLRDKDAPLNEFRMETAYFNGEKGYTDYPFLGQEPEKDKNEAP